MEYITIFFIAYIIASATIIVVLFKRTNYLAKTVLAIADQNLRTLGVTRVNLLGVKACNAASVVQQEMINMVTVAIVEGTAMKTSEDIHRLSENAIKTALAHNNVLQKLASDDKNESNEPPRNTVAEDYISEQLHDILKSSFNKDTSG